MSYYCVHAGHHKLFICGHEATHTRELTLVQRFSMFNAAVLWCLQWSQTTMAMPKCLSSLCTTNFILHLVYECDPASIQDPASIIGLTANTPIYYMTPASIWGNTHVWYMYTHTFMSIYYSPGILLLPFCFYNFTTCTLCALFQILLICCVPLICLPMYACGFNRIHVPDALIL